MRTLVLLMAALAAGFTAPAQAPAKAKPKTSTTAKPAAPAGVTLRGQVLHPKGPTVSLAAPGEEKPVQAKLDAAGRFELKRPWKTAGSAVFGAGDEVTYLWLAPGDDLTLTLDAARFDETVAYTGRGARINNYLAAQVLGEEVLSERAQQAMGRDEKAFRVWLDSVGQARQAQLVAAFPKPTPTEAAFRVTKTEEIAQLKASLEGEWRGAQLTRPGLPAPDPKATTVDGQPFSLESLRGKVVYVDFWAAWCGPCRAEMPAARALHAALHDRADEVVFLNISIDAKAEQWKKGIETNGVEGLNVHSPGNWQSEAVKAYGLSSIPRYLILGPDGRILDGDAPRPSGGAEAAIRKALPGKP